MLCADKNTFLNLKPIFNNWYYMLISFISYSNPTFNISDLHLHLASNVYIYFDDAFFCASTFERTIRTNV